jgi:uncharacterized phage-associated protein
MSTIFEIADHILANSRCGLSHRELQKILYFAQGFYLAKTGEPLFQGEFQAWKHGPVNSGIYHKYKAHGYHAISKPSETTLSQIPTDIAAFLGSVTQTFSVLTQATLIDYSHMDMPWAANYIPDANILLPKNQILEYFRHFSGFDDYNSCSAAKMAFVKLIDSRKDYLDNLPNIGDAWISGKAVAPNQKACQVAKAFLHGMTRHMFSIAAKPRFPKLVMGPIPSGGVSLELVANNSLYLHFHNDERVEVEIERNGEFKDSETSIEQFEEDFSNFYEVISV